MDEHGMYPYDQSYDEMKAADEYIDETLTDVIYGTYIKSLWDKVLNKD